MATDRKRFDEENITEGARYTQMFEQKLKRERKEERDDSIKKKKEAEEEEGRGKGTSRSYLYKSNLRRLHETVTSLEENCEKEEKRRRK